MSTGGGVSISVGVALGGAVAVKVAVMGRTVKVGGGACVPHEARVRMPNHAIRKFTGFILLSSEYVADFTL
jgi:hypothetical protein